MKNDIPLKPGYYWAKWRIPSDDTPPEARACPSDTWEIVQVNANSVDWEDDPTKEEALSVAVPGVRETQWRDCFVWGEFVGPLKIKVRPRCAPHGYWYGQYLDLKADNYDLVRALQPVAKEIAQKGREEFDDSWKPDYHIELTLAVRECRAIQQVLKRLG